MEVQLHTLRTSALHAREWYHAPAALSQGNNPLAQVGWVGRTDCLNATFSGTSNESVSETPKQAQYYVMIASL
jgi:hypothetical protein